MHVVPYATHAMICMQTIWNESCAASSAIVIKSDKEYVHCLKLDVIYSYNCTAPWADPQLLIGRLRIVYALTCIANCFGNIISKHDNDYL